MVGLSSGRDERDRYDRRDRDRHRGDRRRRGGRPPPRRHGRHKRRRYGGGDARPARPALRRRRPRRRWGAGSQPCPAPGASPAYARRTTDSSVLARQFEGWLPSAEGLGEQPRVVAAQQLVAQASPLGAGPTPPLRRIGRVRQQHHVRRGGLRPLHGANKNRHAAAAPCMRVDWVRWELRPSTARRRAGEARRRLARGGVVGAAAGRWLRASFR